jgi:hypothetical protein
MLHTMKKNNSRKSFLNQIFLPKAPDLIKGRGNLAQKQNRSVKRTIPTASLHLERGMIPTVNHPMVSVKNLQTNLHSVKNQISKLTPNHPMAISQKVNFSNLTKEARISHLTENVPAVVIQNGSRLAGSVSKRETDSRRNLKKVEVPPIQKKHSVINLIDSGRTTPQVRNSRKERAQTIPRKRLGISRTGLKKMVFPVRNSKNVKVQMLPKRPTAINLTDLRRKIQTDGSLGRNPSQDPKSNFSKRIPRRISLQKSTVSDWFIKEEDGIKSRFLHPSNRKQPKRNQAKKEDLVKTAPTDRP